jgi:hypothetical protein
MRKLLIAFSVFVLVAGVANAQTQDVKKAADTKKECGKCPAATAAAKECPGMTAVKADEAKACDHAKTTEMSADCKAKTEGSATAEAKACCKEAAPVAKSEEKPAAGK